MTEHDDAVGAQPVGENGNDDGGHDKKQALLRAAVVQVDARRLPTTIDAIR